MFCVSTRSCRAGCLAASCGRACTPKSRTHIAKHSHLVCGMRYPLSSPYAGVARSDDPLQATFPEAKRINLDLRVRGIRLGVNHDRPVPPLVVQHSKLMANFVQ